MNDENRKAVKRATDEAKEMLGDFAAAFDDADHGAVLTVGATENGEDVEMMSLVAGDTDLLFTILGGLVFDMAEKFGVSPVDIVKGITVMCAEIDGQIEVGEGSTFDLSDELVKRLYDN